MLYYMLYYILQYFEHFKTICIILSSAKIQSSLSFLLLKLAIWKYDREKEPGKYLPEMTYTQGEAFKRNLAYHVNVYKNNRKTL